MRIKMSKNFKGSEDGIRVRDFREGDVYEVSDTLGQNFVSQEVAEESSDELSQSSTTLADQLGVPGMAPKQPAARQMVNNERVPLGKADPNAEVVRPLEDAAARTTATPVGNSELSTLLEEQRRETEEAQDTDGKRQSRSNRVDAEGKALKGTDYDNKAIKPGTLKGK